MIFKLFLSSPTDVSPERDAAERVVANINRDEGPSDQFKLIRWEPHYYVASATFQEQIPPPSQCDIVICIYWQRSGVELPEEYRRADGSLPTGSEYEFENAMDRATSSPEKLPDVLVYKKTADPIFIGDDVALAVEQRRRVVAYWEKWFRNEQGHFVAGFQKFADAADFERMFDRHLRQWLDRRLGSVDWRKGSPFRGLKPFEPEHAPIFFGRRREIERARARLISNALAGSRFLLIVGASGSGKSSLARAGVVPRLAEPGGLGDVARTMRRTIVTPALLAGPDGDWASGLARAFATKDALDDHLAQAVGARKNPADILRDGGAAAAVAVARALDAISLAGETECALVIVVDQLEELFAWPPEEADRFAGLLDALTGAASVLVVATMRSDFQSRLRDRPSLAKLAGLDDLRRPDEAGRTLDIGLPTLGDLSEMITGPARAAGLRFERSADGETDLRSLIEAEVDAAALPALQLLLSELYERRDTSLLTLEAHATLGGVGGVMAVKGEETIRALGPEADAAFPNVVRLLLSVGASRGEASAIRAHEAAFVEGTAERRLLDGLRDAALVVSDAGLVRISHESLVGGWDRLSRWFETERRLLDARDRLARHCRRYDATAREVRDEAMFDGVQLAEARELLDSWGEKSLAAFEPALPDFIEASIKADNRRRRSRYAAVAAVFSLSVGVIAVIAWLVASSARLETEAATSNALARAEVALRSRRSDDAIAAARSALALSDTRETRSTALRTLMDRPAHLEAAFPESAKAAFWQAPDRFATLSADGAFVVRRRDGEKSSVAAPAPVSQSGSIAPDGAGGVVGISDKGEIRRWEPGGNASAAAQAPAIVKGPEERRFIIHARSDARDADGRVVIALSANERTSLVACRLQTEPTCEAAELSQSRAVVALSSDARKLAFANRGGANAIQVVAIDQGRPMRRATFDLGGQADEILRLAWSADGGAVAVGFRSGRLALVDLSDGVQTGIGGELRSSSAPVVALAFSPTARRLAYVCGDGVLCLVDAERPGNAFILARLPGAADSPITQIVWAPDGARFAGIDGEGKTRVWRASDDGAVLGQRLVAGDTALATLAVDRGSGRIAGGAEDGAIWIWSGVNDPRPRRLAPPANVDGGVRSLAFAADGALAVGHRTRDGDGFLSIWAAGAEAPFKVASVSGDWRRLAWIEGGQSVAIGGWAGDGSMAIVPRQGEQGVLRPRESARAVPLDGVVGHPNGGAISSNVRGAIELWRPQVPAETLVSETAVADRSGAGSLAIHPNGRWLTASRSDGQIKIYDLATGAVAASLPIFSVGSRVVGFSPDGARLAALASDGLLYLWRFDDKTGGADLRAAVPAAPSDAGLARQAGDLRQASWVDWVDDDVLAISTQGGRLLLLNCDEGAWTDAMARIDMGWTR